MKERDRGSLTLDRRSFVAATLASTVAGGRLGVLTAAENRAPETKPSAPEIIDTNVHLFQWPYRALKYDRTDALVRKLRRHRITQAWAGSFEAVLQKQLDRVNRRLVEQCKTSGEGMLIPIGSVNPAWPDWQEDLRRCHEQYKMPGIRLYPSYHGYALDHPEVPVLLAEVVKRGMFVQIAILMEDQRVHHVSLVAPAVEAGPVPDLLARVPKLRVQLLNAATALRGGHVKAMVEQTDVAFDIAAIETQGGVGRLIDGTHPNYPIKVPVERLLFGSHAPFFPCESAVLKLFESPLSLEQLEMVMQGNARRMMGERG